MPHPETRRLPRDPAHLNLPPRLAGGAGKHSGQVDAAHGAASHPGYSKDAQPRTLLAAGVQKTAVRASFYSSVASGANQPIRNPAPPRRSQSPRAWGLAGDLGEAPPRPHGGGATVEPSGRGLGRPRPFLSHAPARRTGSSGLGTRCLEDASELPCLLLSAWHFAPPGSHASQASAPRQLPPQLWTPQDGCVQPERGPLEKVLQRGKARTSCKPLVVGGSGVGGQSHPRTATTPG